MSRRRVWKNRLLCAVVWAVGLPAAGLLVFVAAYACIHGIESIRYVSMGGEPSVMMGTVGLGPFIINTILVLVPAVLLAVPLGCLAAMSIRLLLREGRMRRVVCFLFEMWACMPVIVYAMVGSALFSTILGFGISLLTGMLTVCAMLVTRVCYEMLLYLCGLPADRIHQAIAMGARRRHLLQWIYLSEALPQVMRLTFKCILYILGEGTLLLAVAGSGAMIAGTLAAAYAQSGGTLSVMLFVYAWQNGDTTTGFTIAFLLMLIVLALHGVASRYEKKRLRAHNLV